MLNILEPQLQFGVESQWNRVLLIKFIVLLEYMEYMKPDKNFSLFLGVSVLATLLLITGMNLSGIVAPHMHNN